MLHRIIKSLQGTTIKTCGVGNKSKKSLKFPINDTIVDLFSTDPFFATYIELLPDQGMQAVKEQRRIPRMVFTKSEDNLLALGMEQFSGPCRFEMIREHLLPTRTPKQLLTRSKNLCSRYMNSNPVALFKKDKVLPELETKVKIVIPRGICFLFYIILFNISLI